MGNGLRSVQLGLGTETDVSGSVGLLEAFQAGLVFRPKPLCMHNGG